MASRSFPCPSSGIRQHTIFPGISMGVERFDWTPQNGAHQYHMNIYKYAGLKFKTSGGMKVASIQVSTRCDAKTSAGFPLHQAKVPFVSLLVEGSPVELVSAITLTPSFISVSTAQAGEVLHTLTTRRGTMVILGAKLPLYPPPPPLKSAYALSHGWH